jgi:4'-phosphopantetheinyl transferase
MAFKIRNCTFADRKFRIMPILFIKEVAKNIRVGVWEITETADWFLSQINLSDHDKKNLAVYVNEQRKTHGLAYRKLLTDIFTGKDIEIEYDENGKPSVLGFDGHISVSHAGKYAAVIVSEKQKVGIDIEKITSRIEKIAHKFMGKEEELFIPIASRQKYLYLIWGAKEALYKMYGKRNLDFKENIFVKAFADESSGCFDAEIKTEKQLIKSRLEYEILDGYTLVYTVENALN